MHVTVKFFSFYREMAGTDRLAVDVAEDATVGQLVHVLAEELQSPTLAQEPVVLMVNHSTRQNSVVLFDCYLITEEGRIRGEWGYGAEDKPPWNVGPESTIAFSPACIFDLPDDEEVPEYPEVLMQFITASGKHFSHRFTKCTPQFGRRELRQAA